MRRWINNDTVCRLNEYADSGFDTEIIDAAVYDKAIKQIKELVKVSLALEEYCIAHPNYIKDIPDDIWVPFTETLKNAKKISR